jgi:hypothetical protein
MSRRPRTSSLAAVAALRSLAEVARATAAAARSAAAGVRSAAAGVRWAAGGGLVAGALVAGSGCIIPDAGIVVQDEFLNTGAVRIVEPTPVTARADDDCADRTPLSGCPYIPASLPSGLIRSDSPLCVCPPDYNDFGLGGGFDIFVEDPDIDVGGDPKDEILGALLLDMPADAEDPRDYLAYITRLPPELPARLVRASDVQTIERPDPHLKSWTLGERGPVDLCNDNDNIKLEPGLHELRLIVTDRPWYRPLMRDEMGEPVYDEEGELVYLDPVVGMPDLPTGATYDTTAYVFRCYDSAAPEGIECDCEERE